MCSQFVKLFECLQKPKVRICDAGNWVLNSWHWSICDFSVIMSVAAISGLNYIIILLQNFSPVVAVPNQCVWWSDSCVFWVKSTYLRLHSCVEQVFIPSSDLKVALKCVWKTIASSNVQVFVWRLLLNQLQTRDELVKWGVISGAHSRVCQLCSRPEEFSQSFFSCLYRSVSGVIFYFLLDWGE